MKNYPWTYLKYRWTSLDSPHQQIHRWNLGHHSRFKRMGLGCGDSESWLYYTAPGRMTDDIATWGLDRPAEWNQRPHNYLLKRRNARHNRHSKRQCIESPLFHVNSYLTLVFFFPLTCRIPGSNVFRSQKRTSFVDQCSVGSK